MTSHIPHVRSSPPTDEELLARVQAGFPDGLGELFDRYGQRAYRVARSICEDPDRAHDAVHTAFVAIWQARVGPDRRPEGVAAWLLSTVRERAIDLTYAAGGPRRSSAPETGPSTLLDALPDAQHELISLALDGGLSHVEIAAHLGLPAGPIEGRMRMGLNKHP